MYVAGQGVVRNMDEAVRWFRAAAEQDHDEAQQKLGYLYLARNANPDQDPDAERWITRLAELSSFDIRYKVGRAYLDGDLVPRDTDKAVKWFGAASDSLARGKSIASRLADDGILREVAELGYGEAQFVLGKRYATGTRFPKSLTEAAKWYYLAGSQGHVKAQFRLGRAYARAEGVPKDYAEAIRWYGKAAEQGDAESQYRLGMLYMRGYGISQDLILAHKWLNLASTRDHLKAKEKREEVAEVMSPADLAEAERLAVEWEPQK